MVSEHASPLAALGGVDAGGQNVHVAALASALADRGHDVEVFTRRDDPAQPERVTMHPGVDVVHVAAGPAKALPKDDLLAWMPAFAADLTRRWSDPDRRPDVVHAHFWMSGVAALEAGRATGVPVAVTFHALGSVKRRHQGDYDSSPPQRVRLEAALARDVDLVVATCTDEVGELVDLVRGDGPRADGAGRARRADADPFEHLTDDALAPLRVVPCGVDVEHFRPDGPRALPTPDPASGLSHRLVSVSRLVERKGVDAVVRALPVLDGVELVVVGGGAREHLDRDPEAVRLRALADDLGVGERVHLVGRVDHDDLPAVLRSADVVVATPWYEPFGIVPLEAMACGVPVVGSAVGGLLDTVAPGVTGDLVPARDPAALAAALTPLLEDEALATRYGRAARARVVERFGWDQVAAATEAAYAEMLARRAAATAPQHHASSARAHR